MTSPSLLYRPYTTVVLAMSADGKIADGRQSPARFGSAIDKSHLETQMAQADGILFGAGTLRAYRTTLKISNSLLLQKRQQQGKPSQPIHIVCSRSARFDPQFLFFQQPVPRWLLTTPEGASHWRTGSEFERILTFHRQPPDCSPSGEIDWLETLHQLVELDINQLLITGGGQLVAALLAADLIDEFRLTICPLILGGTQAPTPVEGIGFSESWAPRLELLSAEVIDHEVFLHYRRSRSEKDPGMIEGR